MRSRRPAPTPPYNFGTTVEATEADFISVHEYNEGTVSVSGTGWVEWQVNVAHLPDVNSEIFFRIVDTGEGNSAVVANAVRTADYTGTGSDPYLEIYEEADSVNRASRSNIRASALTNLPSKITNK